MIRPLAGADAADVPALPMSPSSATVWVSSEAQLEAAIQSLQSNTTIVLAPGTYRIRTPLLLDGPLSNVEIRGLTDDRHDVVLVGSHPDSPDSAGWTRSALVARGAVRGLIIAGITFREFADSAITLGAGSDDALLFNLRLVDGGRQFVKATDVVGAVIEHSAFELTESSSSTTARAIDATNGTGWVVRHSEFRDFRALDEASAEPAVTFRGGSTHTEITSNRFVNCQREVLFGGSTVAAEHRGGFVRNNFIVRESWVGGGAAIAVASSPHTRVVHNSILLNGSAPAAIDIAFAMTSGVLVRNNLTDAPIVVRDGATAEVAHNESDASPSFFVNASAGDLHLLSSATTVIDRAPALADSAQDWDGDARPSGSGADYGADEVAGDPAPASDPTEGLSDGADGSEDAAAPRVLATSDSLLASSTLAAATGVSLPSPWLAADIGASQLAGSVMYSSGTFLTTASGTGVDGTSDQLHFVYQTLTGDCDVTVRVASLESVSKSAKGGVMIRQSLQPGSTYAFMRVSTGEGLAFHRRRSAGGTVSSTSPVTGVAPHWVRLLRSGSTFSAYRSQDGVSWKLVGSDTVSMSGTIYVGLATTSSMSGKTATAGFSNVAIGVLPSPWASRDIGSPALAGSASYVAGVFTVTAAGTDIWDASDQFHFVYQPSSGDVEVTARVSSLQNTNTWAKAGLMIRESLAPGSRHANVMISAGSGLVFQQRTSTGGLTTVTKTVSASAPGWVRLVRKGSQFSAYRSSDGTSWTLLGTTTVNMASDAYVGLAVTSHNTATATKSVLTNVTAKTTVTNTPPTVSLTSPLAGQTFILPSSIGLSASAQDPDGTISRVDFYSGTTLLGSDTSSPYTFTWTGIGLGIHTLTAVAQDNLGARKTSPAVTVTIVSLTLYPQVLTFNASADHSSVSSYSLQVFRSGVNPSTGTPVRTQALGKPVPANGQISVNVGSTIQALASGTYFATVTATNAAGSTRSSPSNTFTR